ncbi:hypothetical protein CANCADRAFT_44307 [Tortispora caseinolytica NRRL Y-17796]|uniref:Bromo domain-containing protein n=1 Tax=Tortispora caseinolytica NRRL Y-17796 TaxID=767744 RepID=A0A1E4TFV8_9ASCO|nr:hypothetical protein CANCADRAFT_44307 [Tortispora caseinolytica NRRL Y-17796]
MSQQKEILDIFRILENHEVAKLVLNAPRCETRGRAISVSGKVAKELYQGLSEFEQDLYDVSSAMISEEPVDSDIYWKIDNFYNYAHYVIASSIVPKRGIEWNPLDEEPEPLPSDMNELFKEDLVDMSGRKGFSQSLVTIGKNGPLFSSILKRSKLDTRDISDPPPFSRTSVLPTFSNASTETMIEYVAGPVFAPPPNPNPYGHPLNMRVPTGQWMKRDVYSSFAPTSDETMAIYESDTVASVWYESIGLPKMLKKLERSETRSTEPDQATDGLKNEQSAGKDDEVLPDADQPAKIEQSNDTESAHLNGNSAHAVSVNGISNGLGEMNPEQSIEIDEELLMQWSPEMVVEEDEDFDPEHTASLQEISQMLLDLEKEQFERFQTKSPISKRELKLAIQIKHSLLKMIDTVPPGELRDGISTLIPIVQTSVNGTVPIAKPAYTQRPIGRPRRK